MSLGAIILLIILFICICLVVMKLRYSIKQKEYVERKSFDQRVFNPIREKVWWRK